MSVKQYGERIICAAAFPVCPSPFVIYHSQLTTCCFNNSERTEKRFVKILKGLIKGNFNQMRVKEL
jgi:hypothetical protein